MEKVKMLRIYVSSTDKFRNLPFYEAIAHAAKREGLGGATVFKGIMGFGSSSELQSTLFWEITEKVPVTIEIIDKEEKIDAFVNGPLTAMQEESGKGCMVISFDASLMMLKKGAGKR